MKKFIALLLSIMLPILSGCGIGREAASVKPVTLTLWHNYGGQLKDTMDEMIDEFNETVGKKEGIIVNVTSISGSATLHEKLTIAAYGDPGAPSLPDITTAYPKIALILAEKDCWWTLMNCLPGKSSPLISAIHRGRSAGGWWSLCVSHCQVYGSPVC